MIEMGKIKVNPNISPKTFLILTVFAMFLFLIIAYSAVNNIIKVKNYDKISATVIDVGYHVVYNYTESTNSYHNYIKFDYTYKGNNYQNEQRVAIRSNKKVGDKVNIYVNPNNPNEIVDTYLKNISIIMSIFLLIIIIFLIKAYKIRKNM